MIYAHDWKILGDDRIRRWPADRTKWADKRCLRVEITSWVGTSAIGATHYYLTVEEEENCWWCEKEQDWVQLSCDSSNDDGFKARFSCISMDQANQMARLVVDAVFDPELHELIWD